MQANMQKFVQQSRHSLDSAFLEEINPNFTEFDLQDDGKETEIQEPVMQGNGLTDDIIDELTMESLRLDSMDNGHDEHHSSSNYKSFMLLDGEEKLRVSSDSFISKLGGNVESKIKVVSIFGNTGDGKSHTMNHTFFEGDEVFRTSSEQNCCTLGVWAAFQPSMNALCLDTEGLLGITPNENKRTRMLLKVLAISDIIIYRTRSERLHSDMFQYLGMASKAFVRHFATALQSLDLPGPPQALGPAIIIFHETRNTKCLESTLDHSAEDILRERFAQMHLDLDAFSSIKYVGVQTTNYRTDYMSLINAVRMELENTTVRSPRKLEVIYQALKALNLKFSGEIRDKPLNVFPEQYFTCGVTCESCNERCEKSMGHVANGEPHRNAKRCRYQHQYENKVLMCKACYTNGREVIVVEQAVQSAESTWVGLAKYAWSGSVIECPNCGEIYRARQYWYGNKSPEDAAVRSEVIHIWKGSQYQTKGPNYSAQLVLDGVSFLTETVASVSAQPTKQIKSWMADKVAPAYWKPNNEITNCYCCKVNFERVGLHVHHCRACGEGVCNSCSKNKMPVPHRKWDSPVRVCDHCREQMLKQKAPTAPIRMPEPKITGDGSANGSASGDESILARKYGEVVVNTLSTVVSVLEYPREIIKDTARPSYWVPDAEAPNCALCSTPFGTPEELDKSPLLLPQVKSSPSHDVNCSPSRLIGDRRRHHCRACGLAVCNSCSLHRRPVPERGWTTDVRVCDSCIMVTE